MTTIELTPTTSIQVSPMMKKEMLTKIEAREQLNLGNYKEALEKFNQIIERHSFDLSTYYNDRGVANSNLGNYKEAVRDYNKAIKFDYSNACAYYNRATIYLKSSKYLIALKDFDKAIKLNPEDSNAYYNRGITLIKLNDKEKALQDFRTAVKLGNKLLQQTLESREPRLASESPYWKYRASQDNRSPLEKVVDAHIRGNMPCRVAVTAEDMGYDYDNLRDFYDR